MSPETGAGAWLCASGSQACIGARPAFVANPRAASSRPIRATVGSTAGRSVTSRIQDSVGSPAARVAA